jgi:hypothetical protein
MGCCPTYIRHLYSCPTQSYTITVGRYPRSTHSTTPNSSPLEPALFRRGPQRAHPRVSSDISQTATRYSALTPVSLAETQRKSTYYSVAAVKGGPPVRRPKPEVYTLYLSYRFKPRAWVFTQVAALHTLGLHPGIINERWAGEHFNVDGVGYVLRGDTAIMMASRGGNEALVLELVKRGAEVNARGENG